MTVNAPPETVFDVIAAHYLHRTPHALAGELQVWERGTDMVLAAHFTRTRWFTTTNVETVRFVLMQPEETVIPEVMVLPMRETSWP